MESMYVDVEDVIFHRFWKQRPCPPPVSGLRGPVWDRWWWLPWSALLRDWGQGQGGGCSQHHVQYNTLWADAKCKYCLVDADFLSTYEFPIEVFLNLTWLSYHVVDFTNPFLSCERISRHEYFNNIFVLVPSSRQGRSRHPTQIQIPQHKGRQKQIHNRTMQLS